MLVFITQALFHYLKVLFEPRSISESPGLGYLGWDLADCAGPGEEVSDFCCLFSPAGNVSFYYHRPIKCMQSFHNQPDLEILFHFKML